jgi:hypothetical protein
MLRKFLAVLATITGVLALGVVGADAASPKKTRAFPLVVSSITYSEVYEQNVTFLHPKGGRSCFGSYTGDHESDGYCRVALRDERGRVVSIDDTYGYDDEYDYDAGIIAATALKPGRRYTLVMKDTEYGSWYCSKYNHDGCTWYDNSEWTYKWTFTYRNVPHQTIKRAGAKYETW